MEHPAQQVAFQGYIDAVNECTEQITRLDEQILKAADEWRWAPTVKALQALRGESLVKKPAEKQEMGWFVILDTVRHISKHILPLLAL